MSLTGTIAQREEIRTNVKRGQTIAQEDIPIAGRVVSRTVPKRKRSKRMNRRK